jgi:hypothetical protein
MGLLVQPIAAQINSGAGPVEPMLKLRGEVKDIRLIEEDQGGLRFGLRVAVTLVNDSSQTALVLKDEFAIGATLLAANCEDARAEKYIHQFRSWPSVSSAPKWANWRSKLDTPAPSADLVWVLGPGKSVTYEAPAMIYIGKTTNFDGTNRPWNEIKQSSTPCLQIEIQTWPRNLEPSSGRDNLEFGQRLRRRWLTHGRLELEHLRSEPVQFNFPP